MDLRVYQYGSDGCFIKEYLNVSEASRQTGIIRTAISNAIGLRGRAGGFLWSKEMHESVKPFDYNQKKIKYAQSAKKPIEMYSIDGVFIREFDSALTASRELGIDVSGIRGALVGKYDFSYGFKWKYKPGFYARKHKSRGKKPHIKYGELSEKRRIHSIACASARAYLKLGYIIRKPCERCNSDNSQMHHEDYSKKYDVVWLCKPCHVKRHREMKRDGIDPWINVVFKEKNEKYKK